MLEVSLLILMCAVAAIALPLGISAFAPLRCRQFIGRNHPSPVHPTLGHPTLIHQQPCDDPATLLQITNHAKNTFATLRRSESAASRLVEISEIVQESCDTISVYFKSCVGKEFKPDPSTRKSNFLSSPPLPSFKPGQHIVFHRPATSSQPNTRRCYSLSGMPNDPSWRITVKDATAASTKSNAGRVQTRSKDASVSNWLHTQARVGDRFFVTGPQGRFTLDLASDTKPVLLVAAGVGITPIASMVHHELQFNRSRQKWLFYQVSDLERAPLLTELINRIEVSSGIQGVIACSSDKRLPQKITLDSKNSAHNKSLHIIGGRLDPRAIIDAVQTTDLTVLMCGPVAWMESMKLGFIAAGVEASSVHYESFGGHAVDESSGYGKESSGNIVASDVDDKKAKVSFSVKFETSQIETTFDGSKSDLLAHAKASDVEIPTGCRMGNCGSCAVKLLQGAVDYKHPPASSLGPDEILPCVCIPTSDLVIQA